MTNVIIALLLTVAPARPTTPVDDALKITVHSDPAFVECARMGGQIESLQSGGRVCIRPR